MLNKNKSIRKMKINKWR